MAIKLYDENLNEITSIRIVADGGFGDIRTKQVFLRNDSVLHYYTDIVASFDNAAYSSGFMRDGYTIKIVAMESQPTMEQWDLIGPGEPTPIPDIGELGAADTANYTSVYVLFGVPAGQPVSLITDVSLVLSYIERLA